MTDLEIIELYRGRSEDAITQTKKQYGAYCSAVAMRILHNKEDAEECVNDAYLALWNAIPPESPDSIKAFIGGITRNLSVKLYKKRTAKKRGGDETTLLLSELEACVPSAVNVQNEVEVNDLARIIDEFLHSGRVTKQDRIFFVNRYSYGDTVPEIARQFAASESKVKMSLFRTRKKLKIELMKRGITL